ncbi:hypothetical protein [Vibrio gazogenes]|uniref:Sel1 repeat family protein n=1 Tax=Vibrio gazogenes TaxID=687 RepID=A0A1Z2SLN3_VIBGA|nr:hypothetical protein [Vibrio gazogenes]ASA58111.1 hypothetical protein BSQ33_20705 [Vibrio gazogenes]
MNQIIKSLLIYVTVFSYESFAATVDDGITQFNQMQYKQAQAVFEPLVKQGNARAMFWLGVTQFRTGEQFKAGHTLLKSAEAGNPWAMLMMSPKDNGYCDYLGWPCDPSWRDKAFSTLQVLADQGNGNAICTLLYRKGKPWWTYVPILNKKRGGELAEKGVKDGWYRMASCGIPMDIKKRVELLQYAAQHHYAPAMVALYYLDEKGKYKMKNSAHFLHDAMKLGYDSGAAGLFHYLYPIYHKINTYVDIQNLTAEDYNKLKELYFYSLVSQGLGYKDDFNLQVLIRTKNNENKVVKLISSDEENKIEERAKDFLKKVKPNLFLDESSNMNALLNP